MRILQLRTDSQPESLGDARRQVRDAVTAAGLPLDPARNLEVAVGEALANVHQHAYAGRGGPVYVEVLSAAGVLTVVVRDEGQAATPPAVPLALPPGSATGGRGLYLASRLVDNLEISVNPEGHGVTVRMTARLQPTHGEPSSGGRILEELAAPLRGTENGPPDEPSEGGEREPGTRH